MAKLQYGGTNKGYSGFCSAMQCTVHYSSVYGTVSSVEYTIIYYTMLPSVCCTMQGSVQWSVKWSVQMEQAVQVSVRWPHWGLHSVKTPVWRSLLWSTIYWRPILWSHYFDVTTIKTLMWSHYSDVHRSEEHYSVKITTVKKQYSEDKYCEVKL